MEGAADEVSVAEVAVWLVDVGWLTCKNSSVEDAGGAVEDQVDSSTPGSEGVRGTGVAVAGSVVASSVAIVSAGKEGKEVVVERGRSTEDAAGD